MDSKKMYTNWLILFVLLMLVPGSTLNVIESTETTTVTSFASTPIPTTVELAKAMKIEKFGITLKKNTKSEESFTTTEPSLLTLDNATTTFNVHSISSTSAGYVMVEPEITAKSSIISLTTAEGSKEGENVAKNIWGDSTKVTETSLAVATKFSTTKSRETIAITAKADFTEAKVTKVAATARSLSGSSAQPTTTKFDVIIKGTKASLNRTKKVDKMTGGRSVTGERDENDGSRFYSKVAMSTAVATSSSIVNVNTTPITITTTAIDLNSTKPDVTTIESQTAAAIAAPSTAQFLSTSPFATASSNEHTERNHENITNGIYTLRTESNHNNINNYSYNQNKAQFRVHDKDDKNYGKIDSAANSMHINSSDQQWRRVQQQKKAKQTHPLQRPKIQKNNNVSNSNNSNYLYNSNNNYFSSQQNAHGNVMVMQQQHQQQPLEQLRPQYARQVQQQQHYHLAAIMPMATLSTTAAIYPAFGSNLINDKNFKQNEANLNKSTSKINENTQKTEQTSSLGANNISYTSMTTNSGSVATGAAAMALDEGVVANTATNVSTFPTVTTTTMKSTTRRPPPTTTPRPTPSIDDYQTVISQAGTHAYLPCNVKQLVKKPISWLRVRDGHILTVDQTTFIADQRFQSIFAPNPERWSLQIKYVQLKDQGTYECQVSTEPKASAIVTLRVVEPRTELIGEPTRHVKAGSQVKLRCIISQALEPPLFINWFHNQKQIYLHSRRGWRTEIERIELPLTEAPTTPTSKTTTTTITTSTPTARASPTTEQVEEATTQTDSTAAEVAASATLVPATTIISLANDFDSYRNTLKRVADTPSGKPTVSGKGMSLATTTTTLVNTPTHSTVSNGYGSGNTTSPMLAAVAAAAVTMSTALPTVTKTMRWPTTTITTSTTLAAVEVRQITTASLIIPSVEKQDSGNYTCSPSNSAPKTVVLHVLNGEYSASAITSGVRRIFIIGSSWKYSGVLLSLLAQNWHQKLTAILILMKMIPSLLLRVKWRMHIKSAETTVTLDNVATPIDSQLSDLRCTSRKSRNKICFHTTQKQSGTCQLADDCSYYKKYNKSRPFIGSIARLEGNDMNCEDECRIVGWRTEKALHLLATKEKT